MDKHYYLSIPGKLGPWRSMVVHDQPFCFNCNQRESFASKAVFSVHWHPLQTNRIQASLVNYCPQDSLCSPSLYSIHCCPSGSMTVNETTRNPHDTIAQQSNPLKTLKINVSQAGSIRIHHSPTFLWVHDIQNYSIGVLWLPTGRCML